MQHKKKEKKIKPYKKRKAKKEENLLDNQKDLISLLAPEVIEEKRDYIYLGSDKYARIFSLVFYPNKIWLVLIYRHLQFHLISHLSIQAKFY